MPNSLYRAARFATFEVACEYSRECSPCSSPLETRLARKNKTENGEGNHDGEQNFLSREGGRHFFILASDKNRKRQKNLRSKLVDYNQKQDDHKQRTLKHRNKPNGLKSINHKSQTMTYLTRSSKHVFPNRSATMIDGTEKPKIPSKFAKRTAP